MTGKTDKQFFFEVQLNWLAQNRGILHAHNVNGTICTATPPQFGGEGREWSPEHLFLSSIISCYMSTYLLFVKKLNFAVTHFECNAIGQIELAEGKYKFTHINVYPKIYIAGEALREKAVRAVQKTEQYCLVSNSINSAIIYHTQVLTETRPEHIKKETATHAVLIK